VRYPAPLLDSSGNRLECSHSNFQYAWQAATVLEHLRNATGTPPFHVFELGGGYGGLALYVRRLNRLLQLPVGSYYLIDLPEVCVLQQRYCAVLDVQAWAIDGTNEAHLAEMLDSCDYGTRVFTSFYGFGEFPPEIQAWYHEHLTRYCPMGVVVWNRTVPYPLYHPDKARQTIVDEPVFTEPGTKVVTY
jgi:hypothetical protein